MGLEKVIPASRQSVVHADGISRRVRLDKAANFRDLGGLKTGDGEADGGETKFGRLFRSDQLGLLTADDIALLVNDIGIKRVVDLRGMDEVETAGEGPLAETAGVAYANVPVSTNALVGFRRQDPNNKSAKNEQTSVSHRYFRRLYNDAANFKLILNHLIKGGANAKGGGEDIGGAGGEDQPPTVFNCVAGRDRTGLVAMLVLGAAGVSYEDIADDYAATVRVPEKERGLSRDPKLDEFWKDYIKSIGTTHLNSPEDMTAAMLELLDLMDEDFSDGSAGGKKGAGSAGGKEGGEGGSEKRGKKGGGILGYLDFIGVDAAKLKRLLL